jgi:hypothetical protein
VVQNISWEDLPLTATPEGILVILLGIIAIILLAAIVHKLFLED